MSARLSCLAIVWLGLLTAPWSATSAAPPRPALPPETPLVTISGHYGWPVIAAQLGNGTVVHMIVDTGAPCTLFDSSLRGRLRAPVGTIRIDSARGSQSGELNPAPGISVQGVPLMVGSNVVTLEMHRLLPPLQPHIDGVLGMDCLCHYCVQLDFRARQLRFLDPSQLDTNELGQAFILGFETEDAHRGIPLLRYPGLLGGHGTNTVIDTGDAGDGTAKGRSIRQHAAGSYSGGLSRRFKHFLAVEGMVNRGVQLPGCVWAGNTYTNLVINRRSDRWSEWIGIRFLARHVVTLDFPGHTLYLRQFSTGPI